MGKDAPDRDVDGIDPGRLHHLTDLDRFLQRIALFLPWEERVVEVDRIDLDLEMEIVPHLLANRLYHLEQETRPVLQRAAVPVPAVIDRRTEELRKEVAV